MITLNQLSSLINFQPSRERWFALGRVAGRLTAVIVAGYCCASIFSAVLMSSLAQSMMKAPAKSSSTGAVILSLGHQPNFMHIRKAILERNVFNSEGKLPDETDAKRRDGEGGSAVFDLNAPCQKSTINIELLGTIYMGVGQESFATVRETGYSEADIYRVGDAIVGNEQAVVAAIDRKKLVINNKGVKECLDLGGDKPAVVADGFPTVPGQPATVPTVEAGSGGVPCGAGAGSTVQLEGPYVESELGAGFGKIIQAARLVPNTVDNQVNGFKIFSIDQSSILGRMGFQNGDVITQVNDTSLKLPEQGFALYQALQDERELRVHLLRGGSTPCSITVRIK